MNTFSLALKTFCIVLILGFSQISSARTCVQNAYSRLHICKSACDRHYGSNADDYTLDSCLAECRADKDDQVADCRGENQCVQNQCGGSRESRCGRNTCGQSECGQIACCETDCCESDCCREDGYECSGGGSSRGTRVVVVPSLPITNRCVINFGGFLRDCPTIVPRPVMATVYTPCWCVFPDAPYTRFDGYVQ